MGDATEGGGAEGGRRSRVDAETVAYLSEIVQSAREVEELEEKSLMLSNAVDEIAGMELRVLSDAECSRIVEEMLAIGDVNLSIKLLAIFSDGDKFFELSSSMFGSHVAEKLLDGVSNQWETADETEREAVEETLGALVQAVAGYLMDFAMDRSASHVARALLNTLAGREITPPSKGRPGKKKKKKQAPVGLAAKVVLDSSLSYETPPQPRFPHLIAILAAEVVSAPAELVSQLVEDTYGNPFLQVLLVACQHDRVELVRLAARLLGADAAATMGHPHPLAAAPPASVLGVMQHRIGSHLAELLFRLLPTEEVAELYATAFEGRLLELAMHQTANFVLQSAIASASDPKMVEAMLTELGPHVGELLARRRSGVVASLVAACGRNATGEVAMCRELARGLLKRAAPSTDTAAASSSSSTGGLVEALVTLDTGLRLDDSNGHQSVEGHRFSPPGCAMLATLMRYPPVACQKFTESLNAIPGASMVRLASDPGGCRVVEAFIESSANPKLKAKMMKKLKGSCASLVLHSGATAIAVERCYDAGKMADKETIVSELAGKEADIMAKHYGAALFSRLGVSAFKRDPESWRRRVGSSSNIRREFMNMFEEGSAGEAVGHPPPGSSHKTRTKTTPAPATTASGHHGDEGAASADGGGDGGARAIEHMLLTGADGGASKKGRKRAPVNTAVREECTAGGRSGQVRIEEGGDVGVGEGTKRRATNEGEEDVTENVNAEAATIKKGKKKSKKEKAKGVDVEEAVEKEGRKKKKKRKEVAEEMMVKEGKKEKKRAKKAIVEGTVTDNNSGKVEEQGSIEGEKVKGKKKKR